MNRLVIDCNISGVQLGKLLRRAMVRVSTAIASASRVGYATGPAATLAGLVAMSSEPDPVMMRMTGKSMTKRIP